MTPTAANVGPWKRDGQSWIRRYITGDNPGCVAVRACDNREGGWMAFPWTDDPEAMTPIRIEPQRKVAALRAIDKALGLKP
jgi:hypothetical protein